jgi:uncharacterized membrane-anchored protein
MRLPLRIAVVLLAQLALVGVVLVPQLSARATGDEYLFQVEPYDPVDPFRGTYVDLTYPDLQPPGGDDYADHGTVFLPLEQQGDVWVSTGPVQDRPADGPYLTCDDHSWRLRCGIESYFLPQDEAAGFEELIGSGTAVARVKIDSRGNAALVGVEAR